MPSAIPIERKLLHERLRKHTRSEEAFNVLVRAGCDREMLLTILGGGVPSLRSWAFALTRWVPSPKYWKTLAEKVERASNEIETATNLVHIETNDELKHISLRLAEELRLLSYAYRTIASNPDLRYMRYFGSYRNIVKVAKPALLCRYVERETGRPHFREIPDLLSAVSPRTIGEDALRRRTKRAIAKLNALKQFPQMLDVILDVLSQTKKPIRGHD